MARFCGHCPGRHRLSAVEDRGWRAASPCIGDPGVSPGSTLQRSPRIAASVPPSRHAAWRSRWSTGRLHRTRFGTCAWFQRCNPGFDRPVRCGLVAVHAHVVAETDGAYWRRHRGLRHADKATARRTARPADRGSGRGRTRTVCRGGARERRRARANHRGRTAARGAAFGTRRQGKAETAVSGSPRFAVAASRVAGGRAIGAGTGQR